MFQTGIFNMVNQIVDTTDVDRAINSQYVDDP